MRSLLVRITFSKMCCFVFFFLQPHSDRLFLKSRRSLVGSYQSLISSTTTMSQILMSSANAVSSCFLGGIDHGHAKCVVQRQALVNFSQRETISMRQTFTSPVRHPPYIIPLLARSDISLAMAFVTYILVAALQSGLQSRFHPEIFGHGCIGSCIIQMSYFDAFP